MKLEEKKRFVKTKEDLQESILKDKQTHIGESKKTYFIFRLTKHHKWQIYAFLKAMRRSEYYSNNSNRSIYHKIRGYFCERKRNKLGDKIGIYVGLNTIEPGVLIEHGSSVSVDGFIGKGTVIHGDNCIGNDGISNRPPYVGKNVDIGVGAKIIGDVQIADNTIIGAGAVVVDSFLEPGHVIGGVPAKVIK